MQVPGYEATGAHRGHAMYEVNTKYDAELRNVANNVVKEAISWSGSVKN